MSVDMSQFYQTYFEESFEGLDLMESALLNLNVGTADSETINDIFRAAHSIKGGSATFGFTQVAAFTHVVETLLDEMRDGVREVTQEAVDLLLQSVDCLRAMLTAVRDEGEMDEARIESVQRRLETLLHGEPAAAAEPDEGVAAADTTAAAPPAEDSVADTTGEVEPGAAVGWRIAFRPHEHLLKTGNDPVRMFRELGKLGELTVDLDATGFPGFDAMDPESVYLAWNLTLMAEATRAEVEEIFEIITWAQLGHHEKPCGFLNVCGYYSRLMEFIDHTVSQRFVRREHREMILVDDTPQGLLSQFYRYKAPRVKKWLDR